jgi:hypothetical protein
MLIRGGVARAVGRPRAHYRPFVLTPPLELTLETATSDHADRLERNGCARGRPHGAQDGQQCAGDPELLRRA